jgi:hypothetical protein
MMSTRYIILATIFGMVLSSLSVQADEVILKSGKKFEVEKVWRENGQIWIVFHGLKTRIPQNRVERIKSDSKNDFSNLSLTKEEKPNSNKITRSTPQKSPRLQSKYASPAAPAPRPTKIEKDQSPIFPDEDFRDLRCGTNVSAVKGLKKVQNPDKQDAYTEYLLNKKKLKLGLAKLSSLRCAFWRDRLYMVTLLTEHQSNFTALRAETFRLFGQGLRVDQAYERYIWTAGPHDIMLQYSQDDQQGLLWLRSSKINRQLKLSRIGSHTPYLKWIKSRN